MSEQEEVILLPSAQPYVVALGPTTLSYHETFADALNAYRKVAHHNHAHVGNWVDADVDFDGLTEDERAILEAVNAARIVDGRLGVEQVRDAVKEWVRQCPESDEYQLEELRTKAADLVAKALEVKP